MVTEAPHTRFQRKMHPEVLPSYDTYEPQQPTTPHKNPRSVVAARTLCGNSPTLMHI